MNTRTDLFIEGGTIVTVDETDRVFVGDILIQNSTIAAIAPKGQLTPPHGARTVDARGCIVMPGFVQAHVHLCQTLFRGFAEDVSLMDWLTQYIWPFEGAHTVDSLRASARLGIAELLLGGTTSILDMGTVHHTSAIFEVADECGIRMTSGKAMMDKGQARPPGLKETTAESVAASIELAKRWHGAAEGRLRYAFAPRFILSCTDALLEQTAKAARELGCRIHTHASENPGEIDAVLEAYGVDNVVALHERGLSGSDVILAHCVWLSSEEQRVLRETGTRVVHCPSTNLKLSSGIAHIDELRSQGVSVALGADGAPCNNRLSAFTEMRLAALLQKPRAGAGAMPAREVVRMATLEGARVLGIDDQVGSLEVGKRADIIVVNGNAPHLRPRADVFTTLVYSAEAADVKHVFVDGEWLVRRGELSRLDVGGIMHDAESALDGILERAGDPRHGERQGFVAGERA